MIIGSNIKQITALTIFYVVNLLFILRYGCRLFPESPAGVILLSAAYAILVALIARSGKIQPSKKAVIVCMAVYSAIALMVVSQIPMDQELYKTDRWRIISLFWESVEQGIYPYSSQTEYGNMPGASPVYFLLTYPFYKTGLFALIPVSTLWIWWFAFPEISASARTKGLVLLASSPAFIYEMLTRSSIIFNSILIAIFCVYMIRLPKWKWQTVIANAVLGGLLLNTRTVFIIPFALIWISLAFNNVSQLKKLTLWGGVVAITYLAAFAVLAAIWGIDAVMADNPFTVQKNNLYPSWYMFGLVIASIAVGSAIKPKNAIPFAGCMIFLSGAVYFILVASKIGLPDAMLGKTADITYFSFILPFILPYLNLQRHGERKQA